MARNFDDLLIMIAQETGSIETVIDSFFGFLRRRTDFFVLANPGDRVGLPPGVAEHLIFQCYKRYRDEYDAQHPFVPKPAPPHPVAEESAEAVLPEAPVVEEHAPAEPRPEVPVEISTYNGAQTDKYKWSQDINDVTVQVSLPAGTKSRDLSVELRTKHIKIALKKDLDHPLLVGELPERIKAESSLWQIEGSDIVLTLEKASDVVWKTVLVGDAEIDPKTVDSSRRVDEYDEDTQAGIRKVMYEHQRKLQGLPTSEEEKSMGTLKKFWDSPNSPYKGQEFDPKVFGIGVKPQDLPRPEPEED
jgi:hypothetical protein